MLRYAAIPPIFFLLAVASQTFALEFVSVSTPSAIFYASPSSKAAKQFVVSRYTPLEVVVTLKDWVKVRDQTGTMAWVAKGAVSRERYVAVTSELAEVRQSPDVKSPIVFKARRRVALQWLQDTNIGWVKVRHQDGSAGYINVADVWGD